MRKLLLLLLASVVVFGSSCAAKWYSVSPTSGISPLNDNNAANCSLTPDLWPVAPGTYRMIHYRLVQGASVREDSTSCGAGNTFNFPAWPVPAAGTATKLVWASDSGGVGCDTAKVVVPAIALKAPARPTLY
jgi:hypothetical protein